jgi:hypothetical protein
MSSPLTTAQLLIGALRADQTSESWTADFAQAQADWDDLAVRAIAFGLAPQLYCQLMTWGITIPPRTTAKLAVTYQAHLKRNAAIYEQLDAVLAACAGYDLQPIALKGIHLAAHWYAEPALRPMNDIDLLFTPAELPRAADMLVALGYEGKHKSAELGAGVTKHTSTYRRSNPANGAATPNPYLSTQADRTIEPHTSLEESWFGLKVDMTEGVRERAVTVAFGPGSHRGSGRVLAAEDLLLHLCVHFCFHLIMGAPSLVQLTDLLIVTRKGTIQWPILVERAIANRAAPYALAALTLVHKLLAAPVPEAVLAELGQATPALLRRHVATLELADVLRRSQQKPLTTIRQRLQRGFADRAETARWAPDWRGRLQVWRTALDVTRTDTGRMLLNKS